MKDGRQEITPGLDAGVAAWDMVIGSTDRVEVERGRIHRHHCWDPGHQAVREERRHLNLSPQSLACGTTQNSCGPSGGEICLWADGVVATPDGHYVAVFGFQNGATASVHPTVNQVLVNGEPHGRLPAQARRGADDHLERGREDGERVGTGGGIRGRGRGDAGTPHGADWDEWVRGDDWGQARHD